MSVQPDPTPSDERPEPLTLAQRRGALLQTWMDTHGLNLSKLAQLTGLTEMSLSNYVRGVNDIGRMQPKSITKLLTGMYVSDAWARKYFLIPPELEPIWYSSRAGSMGSLESDEGLVTHHLTTPLKGEWSIPGPSLVTVDPSGQDGLLLAQIGQHYWLAMSGDLPSTATILGQFKYAAPALAKPTPSVKKPKRRGHTSSAPAGA